MLHFSKISTNGKDFNIVASGALAFKIHNKILKDEAFQQGAKVNRNMLLGSAPAKALNKNGRNVFYVILSDLDKMNIEALCHTIAQERTRGSYAVCQVIPAYYNEPSFKALKLLRQNFDEVIELNKFNIGTSKALMSAEQQQCLITDYSLSMARIMYHVCMNNLSPVMSAPVADEPELAYAS
ncbi:hypothetical protein CLV24_109118 [Pontibacter ummariensis]|uniref:Uncharacterized protein n=1 Tax=Pontibacter ummariensis TaxID=1610492 RepID=A0A239FNM2_9BACT|nr:hypothetical protein [Pontibacter ummariensis]PRY11993.1 hypothetical protein CLV24_109118 [Pontibacter ummariensis]SNS58405.1 hypothetical protein SAMN06296052_10952 [Pontibacter ummariensis]